MNRASNPTVFSENAVAILFIKNPDSKGTIPSDVLRELYVLTLAECRLAMLLLQGNSLSDAAAVLEVSCQTVRSQTGSMFQKTGMKRQSQLMALLANLYFDARAPNIEPT